MRVVNIIPMGGIGARFKNTKINVPKPLVKHNGIEIFIESINSFPKANFNIFICREEHKQFQIDKIINKNFKNFKILYLKTNTSGQASTAYKAKKYLRKNDFIRVISCDVYLKFKNFKYLDGNSTPFDVLVISAKPTKQELVKPEHFGWVNFNNNNLITKLICKKRPKLINSNTEIIVGAFIFKNKSLFVDIIEALFSKDIKINNEFYIDMAAKLAIDLGYKVMNKSTNKYLNLGDPNNINF